MEKKLSKATDAIAAEKVFKRYQQMENEKDHFRRFTKSLEMWKIGEGYSGYEKWSKECAGLMNAQNAMPDCAQRRAGDKALRKAGVELYDRVNGAQIPTTGDLLKHASAIMADTYGDDEREWLDFRAKSPLVAAKER